MRSPTTAIPAADLTDETWTVDHVAAFLRLRKSAAYSRTRVAGFPSPCDGGERYRRWRAHAVRRFYEDVADEQAPHAAPAPRTNSVVTFRARKVNP